MLNKINDVNWFGYTLIISLVFCSCSIQKRLATHVTHIPHHIGIKVVDLNTNQVIFSFNEDKKFIPASTLKLATLFTAHSLLQDSIIGYKYNEKNEIAATGNPLLLHPVFKDSSLIKLFQNQKDTWTLIFPPHHFEAWAPGWAWEDFHYEFSAERSVLPIYGNAITLLADREKVVTLPPYFKDSTTIASGVAPRNRFKNRFYAHTRGDTLNIPFITSPELAVRLLEREVGLMVPTTGYNHDRNWKVKKVFPLDPVIQYMLQDSNNFLAEQLMLNASAALGDTISFEIVQKKMITTDLKSWETAKWVDGSGLSRYNLITPNQMTDLLKIIKNEFEIDRLFYLLPRWDKNGTLDSKEVTPNHYILAKSGSMGGIYNLAGYLVTKRGKVLGFTYFNNQFTGGSKPVREQIEQLLTTLHELY